MQPGDANKAGGKLQLLPAAAAEPFEDSNTPTVATYDCPVCRKAHVLDLDRLQVGHFHFLWSLNILYLMLWMASFLLKISILSS